MVVHRQGEAEVQAGTSVPEQTERQSKRKHTDETKRARVAKALRKIDRAKRKGRSGGRPWTRTRTQGHLLSMQAYSARMP